MAKPKVVNLTLNLIPPSAGRSAVFKLTKPDNSVTSKSLLTDQQGAAVAQFSLGPKYRQGMYRGHVDIMVDGVKVSADSSVMV